MKTGSIRPATIEIFPASAERWDDLEKLFGPHGAFGNCWCMYWRLKRSDFSKMSGDEKKAAMKTLTAGKLAPGVLAYGDGQPIGWCSIGPRADFSPLDRSRTLKRVDDTPVWSIVCFFIARPYRRQGVMAALLSGAVDYARQNGALVVEAYPIDMQSHQLEGHKLSGYSGYMGIASIFRAAGFVKISDATETQLIMRYTIPQEG